MTAREVELTGGAPWGFRMHGGADQNQPLRISRCYSDILQRTLDVNPGRKASLSGIREGDVISSINGRATKGMSNSDAHAMLRSAGPVMRLGLNEDREMSPRRRSIGKSSELKRPSQLIAEIHSEKATPQAPVYATIRSPLSPQHRPSSSSARGSLNSLPAALNSIPLVKSIVQNEEPLKFHPTNPFFTTLPSNSSTSKLPVPNGRSSLSSLDRNKVNDSSHRDCNSDFSPIFSKPSDSEYSSLPYYQGEAQNNGYGSYGSTLNKEKSDNFSGNNSQDQFQNQRHKNPFDTKRNSDPFEKYLRSHSKLNGQCEYDSKTMPSSMSDNNFQSNEVITKRSTITEHSINEVEDLKIVKKIVLNGCNANTDNQNGHTVNYEENRPDDQTSHFTKNNCSLSHRLPKNEHAPSTPIHERNDYFNTLHQDELDRSSTRTYEPVYKEIRSTKTQASEVISKPPVISPRTPAAATAPSPIPKRNVGVQIPINRPSVERSVPTQDNTLSNTQIVI